MARRKSGRGSSGGAISKYVLDVEADALLSSSAIFSNGNVTQTAHVHEGSGNADARLTPDNTPPEVLDLMRRRREEDYQRLGRHHKPVDPTRLRYSKDYRF